MRGALSCLVSVAAVASAERVFAQESPAGGARFVSRDSAYSVTLPAGWPANLKASGADVVLRAPGHRWTSPCEVRLVTNTIEAGYENSTISQLADIQTRMIRGQARAAEGLEMTESSFRTLRDHTWWIFEGRLKQVGTKLQVLNYKTIEAQRVYMMTYACGEQQFASNVPAVVRLMETLEFDPRIREQRARTIAAVAAPPASSPATKLQQVGVVRAAEAQATAVPDQPTRPSPAPAPPPREMAVAPDRSVSMPATVRDTSAAGTIAPDAQRLDVDAMSPFFGGHAVIVKANAQALINDTGGVVVPFNKYRFTSWEIDRSNFGEIGRTFYLESHHGALVEFRRNVPNVKVIPFQEIVSERLGYIVAGTGQTVFRKPSTRNVYARHEASWLGGYDELGYHSLGWRDEFTDDGLLVTERYDGTEIIGRGHRRRRPPPQLTEHFNFELQGYASSTSAGHGGGGSVNGLWTNGLTPARRVSTTSPSMASRDPVQVRAARNTAVGLINRKGEFQVAPNHLEISQFSEGLAFVGRVDEFDQVTWGAIDTLGKLVIPHRFRLLPGRFSHGVAIVRAIDVDTVRYAFINKRGEIVFTIRPSYGDTTTILLGLSNEFAEMPQQRFEGFERFFFQEGVQFVRLGLRDPTRPQANRSEVALIDSLGRYTPIERLILQKLPAGARIEFKPRIKDGQLLFSYTGKGINPLTGAETTLRETLGIADIRGNVLIPPRFTVLSLFDPDSRLQYAQVGGDNRESWNPGTQGYIDRTGVFRIVKGKPKSGF